MALALTPGYAFATTEEVTAAKLASLVSAATGSGIDITNFASGSGCVVVSSSSPSVTSAIWIDSGNANTPKYYNGSTWVAIAGAGVPTDYRREMFCMQASTTTITVKPGILDVNGTRIAITADITLTISTAGNWAGGVSLRATNTTGYIGVDASGNIKMHTTAPTHSDGALSITAGTKRYVSWGGTTYRVIGWFRMNATGSGELDTYGVSNLSDGGVTNVVEFESGAVSTGTTALPDDDTIPQNTEGDQFLSLNFVPSNANSKLKITVVVYGQPSAGNFFTAALFQDSTANALASGRELTNGSGGNFMSCVQFEHYMKAATVSLITMKVRAGGTSGTFTFNGEGSGRKLGGVIASSIRIEELQSQLT